MLTSAPRLPLRLPFCLMKGVLSFLLPCLLCLCLSAPQAGAAQLGKKKEPLDYKIFGMTLDSPPKAFRTKLKKDSYLLTKTDTHYGYDVMSFTSAKRHVLFTYVYVASCADTNQTVGVYLVSEDGDALLSLARERFGIGGNNLKDMPKGSSIGGRMTPSKHYLKDYPNVSVSLYSNKPYDSYTLALESRKAMQICKKQASAEVKDAAVLKKFIEMESNKARFID